MRVSLACQFRIFDDRRRRCYDVAFLVGAMGSSILTERYSLLAFEWRIHAVPISTAPREDAVVGAAAVVPGERNDLALDVESVRSVPLKPSSCLVKVPIFDMIFALGLQGRARRGLGGEPEAVAGLAASLATAAAAEDGEARRFWGARKAAVAAGVNRRDDGLQPPARDVRRATATIHCKQGHGCAPLPKGARRCHRLPGPLERHSRD